MNPARPRRFWQTWPGPRTGLAVASGLLLGLLLYALLPGLASTADSRYYLAAARSFARSGQLLNPDGTAYASWGPLYPVLLAAGIPHVRLWATGLHVLSTLTCLWTWGYLGGQLLPGRAVKNWLVLALALAAPWIITAKFFWSEAVFQALFGLYALALYHYLRTKRISWLAWATVWGLLLPLQRTSGLFLLVGVACGLVLAYPAECRRHWRGWLLHLAVGGAGIGAWLWHAQQAAAQPELYRSRGWQGLRETLGDYGYVLTRWLVPVQQAGWPKHWGFELLLPLLLLGLMLAAWRGRQPFVRLLGVVVVVYLLSHIGTTVMSRAGGNVYDVERYAAVVYGPFLLLLGHGVTGLASRRWVVVALACWLAYPAARAVRVAHFSRHMPVQPVAERR
ncbi:hypothetical protein GCM10027048_19360 [Hymenobacter coalescens]